MSTYCVTFRIADKVVGGKSYADRYNKLVANVREGGAGYWEETTSFFLAESDLDTNSFAKKACRGLSANDDMLFLFDPSDMSSVYFGPLQHRDVLESFFPSLKKLP